MDPSIAFLAALGFGTVLGLAMRQLMASRVRLGWAEAVLSGVVGAELGAFAMSMLVPEPRRHWLLVLLAAIAGTVVVMLALGYFSREPRRTAEQLIAGGEGSDVEFKSTARCNLHTGQRDDKIERVVSKTVAALANGSGGDLLIGVDDDGHALGLGEDLKFMKSPDLDRYELWLRDHLVKTLGANATAGVDVSFPEVAGTAVCHVRVAASPRPVFLSPGKGQPVQLWVRVGNSTRQLGVDEALGYAADRWGRRMSRT